MDGQWEGKELGLEDKILKVLKLTDYMMRVYNPVNTDMNGPATDESIPEMETTGLPAPENFSTPIWLYVGYYKSQRTGATYHSPKNCLPGAGWQFVRSDYVTVPLQGTSGVTINQVLIQKGLDQAGDPVLVSRSRACHRKRVLGESVYDLGRDHDESDGWLLSSNFYSRYR